MIVMCLCHKPYLEVATMIRHYLSLYNIVSDYYDKKSKGHASRKKRCVTYNL